MPDGGDAGINLAEAVGAMTDDLDLAPITSAFVCSRNCFNPRIVFSSRAVAVAAGRVDTRAASRT